MNEKSKYNLCGDYGYFRIFKGSFRKVHNGYLCVVDDNEIYGCFCKETECVFHENIRPVKISETTYNTLKNDIIKIAKMENVALTTMGALFGNTSSRFLNLNRL